MAGYTTRVAGMVNIEVYYKRHVVPKNSEKESLGAGDDNTDEDGEAGFPQGTNQDDEQRHPRKED